MRQKCWRFGVLQIQTINCYHSEPQKKGFMNIFHTGSSVVIIQCQHNFNFPSMLKQIAIGKAEFLQTFAASGNHFCLLFENVALDQLNNILYF